MSKIFYKTGKLLYWPLYLVYLIYNKIKFEKNFSVKKFINSEDIAPTNFIFVLTSANGDEYILKESNLFMKKFASNKGHVFLTDRQKVKILEKISKHINYGIPPFRLLKDKLLIKNLKGFVSLASIRELKFSDFEIDKIKHLIIDIIKNLHALEYVHGDLKLKNILINGEGFVYLIDWDNLGELSESGRERDLILLNEASLFLNNIKQGG